MTTIITGLRTTDVRFPTSREFAGSDAMNRDPDYSAAYVVVDSDDGREGHGFAFTIGRGNDVQLAAIAALEPMLVGRSVAGIAELGEISRALIHDSQLRWLGPEKGVMHMALGADAQPTLGRRPGDRLARRPGALRPVVDRGADQPGRRPRPSARPSRRCGWRPASTCRTG